MHSFETLLAHLATRARHTCRVAMLPSGVTFTQVTAPTTLQARAFELLGLWQEAETPDSRKALGNKGMRLGEQRDFGLERVNLKWDPKTQEFRAEESASNKPDAGDSKWARLVTEVSPGGPGHPKWPLQVEAFRFPCVGVRELSESRGRPFSESW